MSKYGVFSGPYFAAFGLNTERYGVSPYSGRMRENMDQKKLRIWTLFKQCLFRPKYMKVHKMYDNNNNTLINCKNLLSDGNLLSNFKSTGWPTKISLFFLGNNFYKNKIFSPQLLEVYRILLVETTLESVMFYYTFSVINTMFVPCTALLYDSTAATRTLKLSTTLLRISCGIHLISHLTMSSLVCRLFSQTLSFRYPLRK